MKPTLTLVTGGARSGKSTFAERLAVAGRLPVVYLATAVLEHGDAEMRIRIELHRQRRPATWRTVEVAIGVGASVSALDTTPGTVLLEDLGLLVSNLLFRASHGGEPTARTAALLECEIARELIVLEQSQGRGGWDLVIVTNEVGLGLVPETPVGRIFRDALGRANQALAARADAVYLLVAGLPLTLKGPVSR